MKLRQFTVITALVFSSAFLLPLTAESMPTAKEQTQTEAPPELIEQVQQKDESKKEDTKKEDIKKKTSDSEYTVRILKNGEIQKLSLYDYLVGVVAAEMPVSFHEQALCAQSVAARTYTLYNMRTGKHENADACTDAACCQAYIDMQGRKDKWNTSFEEYERKIAQAVTDTAGQCLSWENEPIFAAFHSSSDGFTEEAGNVWPTQLPYLVSVYSPETEDNVPNYHSKVEVSKKEFAETVLQEYPQADFENCAEIGETERSVSGRIVSIELGGQKLSGTQFRLLFALRSAAVEISETDTGYVFSVSGYGHGVGMSQYGANTLACAGSSYKEILEWYYSGAVLEDMREFLS